MAGPSGAGSGSKYAGDTVISGSTPSTNAALYEDVEDEYCEVESYGVEAMELANESRNLDERAAAGGRSGMAIVKGRLGGLVGIGVE